VLGTPGAQFGGIPFYYNLRDNSAHYFGGLMPYADTAGPNTPGIALEAAGATALWAAPGTYDGWHDPNLSLMNGRKDCPVLLCLGPSASLDGSVLRSGPAPGGIGAGVTNLLSSSGAHTAELQGTSHSNNRAAFVMSGNFGGVYAGLWEFGTDLAQNGGKDYYFYDYASGGVALDIASGTDLATFGGSLNTQSGKVYSWNGDTGLSRETAGVVDVGNGTQGDKSGTLNAGTVSANVYKGPATAPTGACSVVGWVFSQDGHATFCNGTTWITKI
jgi:hypothetical protein